MSTVNFKSFYEPAGHEAVDYEVVNDKNLACFERWGKETGRPLRHTIGRVDAVAKICFSMLGLSFSSLGFIVTGILRAFTFNQCRFIRESNRFSGLLSVYFLANVPVGFTSMFFGSKRNQLSSLGTLTRTSEIYKAVFKSPGSDSKSREWHYQEKKTAFYESVGRLIENGLDPYQENWSMLTEGTKDCDVSSEC